MSGPRVIPDTMAKRKISTSLLGKLVKPNTIRKSWKRDSARL